MGDFRRRFPGYLPEREQQRVSNALHDHNRQLAKRASAESLRDTLRYLRASVPILRRSMLDRAVAVEYTTKCWKRGLPVEAGWVFGSVFMSDTGWGKSSGTITYAITETGQVVAGIDGGQRGTMQSLSVNPAAGLHGTVEHLMAIVGTPAHYGHGDFDNILRDLESVRSRIGVALS